MMTLSVTPRFRGRRLSRRDDTNHVALTATTVTNDQKTQARAETEQNEPLLVRRVIRIRNQFGALVRENRARLIEAHPVFPEIRRRLGGVPLEAQVGHKTSITIS
jgi:hypothetical protein